MSKIVVNEREKLVSELGCQYVREDNFDREKYIIKLPNGYMTLLSFIYCENPDGEENSVLTMFTDNKEYVLGVPIVFVDAIIGIKKYLSNE